VRYLRMLSNSIAAASLATAYVLALVIELNPTLSIAPGRLAPIVTTVGLFYVVPTILYFLGLPVGRDMDGFARTDLFQRTVTEWRPITFIPTYDR
jgi:hypothetical protein